MMKKNVIFNYIGQFYNSFIGIIILPIYLKFLSEEAYGLIGFFVLLQSWMLLFDLGMSPTLARQVAITNVNKTNIKAQLDLRKLVRSLETIFFVVALLIFILIFFFRYDVSLNWLKVNHISIDDVASSISLMGGMIALRWFSSLYKSGINGYEKQVWLNIFNIFIVTLRMPVVLLIFMFVTNNIKVYFFYQAIISVIEVIFLNRKFYRSLDEFDKVKIPLISKEILVKVLPFAAGTAYTAGIWVFLTQLDKLLLSKILPLAYFGYFSLIVTLVSGILMLSTPVSNAILPRMTSLLSIGKENEMLEIYRLATRFIVCVVGPISILMCLFPYEIILAWTDNSTIATWAEKPLPLYAAGNGLLAVIGFQYFLQYAHGKLKLHVKYNSVLALISIPSVTFFAHKYGAIGTGGVWLALNIITLLLWTGFVHKKFAPGLHRKWLFFDVLLPLIPSLTIFLTSSLIIRSYSLSHGSSLALIIISLMLAFLTSFLLMFYSYMMKAFSLKIKK